GSPEELTVLQRGSWLTQFKELAKAFSHKPALISLGGDCVNVKHNGRLPGFLYTVSEPIGPEDVTYLRDTAQTHWQTNRDLPLRLVTKLPLDDPPQLSQEEIAELRKDIPEGTTAFIGTPDEERTEIAEQSGRGDAEDRTPHP
ncbi:hypothetical protein LCGC14_2957370, partial [marine sediment metagenome]